jgi:hypothetical protein
LADGVVGGDYNNCKPKVPYSIKVGTNSKELKNV